MSLKTAGLNIATLLTLMSTVAFAEEATNIANAIDTSDDVYTLEPVTVVGQVNEEITGSSILGRQQLDRLPEKNGSINEVITLLPGIQPPEQGRVSNKGGEILPPNLSISGGTVYQNNFLINGFGNNSLLDPMADDPTSSQYVPGHPQAIFVPTTLLEEIKVYRYNIPASYGAFTGGVVDATIRTPQPDFSGEINYRTTRDSWTRFHIDKDVEEDFEDSRVPSYQPKFVKQDVGLLLNIPINQNLSLLTSYQVNHSKIPLQHMYGTKDQERINESFLASLAWDIDQDTELNSTLQYSPYEGTYFRKDTNNSDFIIEGGGWQADTTFLKQLASGQLSLSGAIKGSRNNREAPQNLYIWLSEIDGNPSSKPWGPDIGTGARSYEGSVGSLEREQLGFEASADFTLDTLQTGSITHQLAFGIQLEHIHGTSDRYESQSQYNWNSGNENPDVICDNDDPACITGEQVFLSRVYWPVDSTSAEMNLIDMYVEDTINWKRLELRPGLHISYDDFMKNKNFAPRFAANYDIFGSGKTLLIGGWNRYYGKTLLTYKLREAMPGPDSQARTLTCSTVGGIYGCRPDLWPTYDLPRSLYRFSDVDTPYSDETVLGVDQEVAGGRLKLIWVKREGYDEYAREWTGTEPDGHRYYQLTNNGESLHNEYTLEWERQWENHYLAINATYQESTRSNESYTDLFYDDDLYEEIWYEGNYINRADLPRKDFSRPWVANIIYIVKLPKGISFTNVTRYRSGYKGIDSLNTSERAARGITTRPAYINASFPDAWTFDWKFDWDIPLHKKQVLTASLEINNVFNEKSQIGDGGTVNTSSPKDYELGRQFWLGMTYKF